VNNFAVGQDQAESGDVIGGDSVSEGMRAPGIFRNVAADGAGFLTGGIGSEVKAVRFDGAGKVRVDQTGLDGSTLIFEVDFQDAVHAREGDHDAAGAGKGASGKAGACATTDDGSVAVGSEFDDTGDLFRGGGKNDRFGPAFFHRSVIFVKEQVLGSVQDSVVANEPLKFASESVHYSRS